MGDWFHYPGTDKPICDNFASLTAQQTKSHGVLSNFIRNRDSPKIFRMK